MVDVQAGGKRQKARWALERLRENEGWQVEVGGDWWKRFGRYRGK